MFKCQYTTAFFDSSYNKAESLKKVGFKQMRPGPRFWFFDSHLKTALTHMISSFLLVVSVLHLLKKRLEHIYELGSNLWRLEHVTCDLDILVICLRASNCC